MVRAYRETPRPMGVFAVRNTADGRILVGSSANLPGTLNRQRFDLENGTHRDRDLQADWDRLGERSFAFETLDTLDPLEDPGLDPSHDLAVLLDMWLERLGLSKGGFYTR